MTSPDRIAATGVADHRTWPTALRRYMAVIVPANLVWEIAQLPLYTIWRKGSWSEVAFAAFHCAAGDVLIAGVSLLGALLLLGSARWPDERYLAVATLTFLAGLAYTIFSEWLNTEVRGSWTYSDLMPRLPVIGTGLSPLAQWFVIPLAAFWWARRHPPHVPSQRIFTMRQRKQTKTRLLTYAALGTLIAGLAGAVDAYTSSSSKEVPIRELAAGTHFHGISVDPADSSRISLATHHGFYLLASDGEA